MSLTFKVLVKFGAFPACRSLAIMLQRCHDSIHLTLLIGRPWLGNYHVYDLLGAKHVEQEELPNFLDLGRCSTDSFRHLCFPRLFVAYASEDGHVLVAQKANASVCDLVVSFGSAVDLTFVRYVLEYHGSAAYHGYGVPTDITFERRGDVHVAR